MMVKQKLLRKVRWPLLQSSARNRFPQLAVESREHDILPRRSIAILNQNLGDCFGGAQLSGGFCSAQPTTTPLDSSGISQCANSFQERICHPHDTRYALAAFGDNDCGPHLHVTNALTQIGPQLTNANLTFFHFLVPPAMCPHNSKCSLNMLRISDIVE